MKDFQNVLLLPKTTLVLGGITIHNNSFTKNKILSITEDPLQITFTDISTEYNGQSAFVGIQNAPGADSEKYS